jgi:ubiquinone/menaquinone biosynthesis C-methylase UbiE
MNISQWNDNNNQYWNEIAKGYDGLYQNNWSAMENEFVSKQLTQLIEKENCKILDLGCGTGLGYFLIKENNPSVNYIGLDASNEMLKIAKQRFPEVEFANGFMSELGEFNSSSFDLIISTFTAFSYTEDVAKTIAEIIRVLKPNGKIFISALSRWSVRRFISFKFSTSEKYKTRESKSNSYSFANVYSANTIREIFLNYSFREVKTTGYNAFGGLGVLQKFPSLLWGISKSLGTRYPDLSHEIILSAKRN